MSDLSTGSATLPGRLAPTRGALRSPNLRAGHALTTDICIPDSRLFGAGHYAQIRQWFRALPLAVWSLYVAVRSLYLAVWSLYLYLTVWYQPAR